MSYFKRDEVEYDDGGADGKEEFDYGGLVAKNDEENITLDQVCTFKNVEEEKEDLATRGERSYSLGPIYAGDDGYLYNPISGNVLMLTQSGLSKDNGSKRIPWPGLPEDKEIGWICHHDTYPFEGVPWGICLKYDEKRGNHEMHPSVFCSPNCVRTYLMERFFEKRHTANTFLYIYNVMKVNRNEPLFPANTASVLKRFHPKTGISIEEFRKEFLTTKIEVLPANLLSVVTLIEEIHYKRESNDVLKKRKEMEKRIKKEQCKKRRKTQNDSQQKKELFYENIKRPNSMMKAMFMKARSTKK